jgi:hypothetical protein
MFILLLICVSPPFTTFWFASSPALLENNPKDGEVTFAVLTGDEVAFTRYGYWEELGYRVSEPNIG